MKAGPAKKRPKLKSTATANPRVSAAISEHKHQSTDSFPIAAIGASAGGLEAFVDLVRELPPDTGMVFVLIQHLDPKQHSLLAELVSRETPMSVEQATDGARVEPNHIYVIPPNKALYIEDHTLRLKPRGDSRNEHMTVDFFMRSLAEDQGNRAIGVILSGTDSDGTLGMGEIQAQGGVTFAQDETTAKYDGMPRSAIAAGAVDFVLPPKGIARELARIARHPYAVHARKTEGIELIPEDAGGLNQIFQMLRKTAGVDFSYYRQTTIRRRIQRRMMVHKIDRLADYLKFLRENPGELRALYQDLLINVTSFFRNPTVFDALKAKVFPAIFKNRTGDAAIRIWTPGCATGEETYSLAIALLEFLGDRAQHIQVQFFGTDVSDASVSKARAGFYTENIHGDVSAERLRRFFIKAEGGYRVSKNIRDLCIFAQHNVLSDPPFSQMDLICCRNLLIYLEPMLQKRVISLFHYATRPTGFLVLGTSEGVGTAGNLFSLEDRASKIFARKVTVTRPNLSFAVAKSHDQPDSGGARRAAPKPVDGTWNYVEAQKEFDRRLLSQFSPATAFVNADLEIIHTRGPIDRYLKLAPGRASLSVLKMLQQGLLFDLRNAIAQAGKGGKTVRKQKIQMRTEEKVLRVDVEVVPVSVPNVKDSFFMVIFSEAAPPRKAESRSPKSVPSANASRRIEKLEQELAASKEYLHSVIERHEAANEELQSANEETLSSNEELQSTNEELETAKEELQSTNEELTTLNEELRNRNYEVTQINSDLSNLVASINVGVVMLGSDLSIRRITQAAQKSMGVIASDVGRPITNINPAIEMPDMKDAILGVIERLVPFEREVKDKAGNLYNLRIVPYRTLDNKIDGVVITLMDLNESRVAAP
ncbi:MAG TPA: chemotaxis protein CheB [Candidatus Acidoferrales bacterium]|nr:chemotaxis protein CheB [Candidatus Acidoferrales bacterium]